MIKCSKCGSSKHIEKDGITADGFQRYRHRGCPENDGKSYSFTGEQVKLVKKEKNNESYLSEMELRARHDMYYKLKHAIEKIEKGKFMEEQSLLRSISIWGKAGYRSAVDRQEIKHFKGKADGIIYYGHPDSIEKLKREGVLV